MRIGFEKGFYPEKRCIINKVESAEYKDITFTNPRQILHKIQRKLSLKWIKFDLFKYRPVFKPRVDVIHFFNSVSYAGIPWVCTIETFLPRMPELYTYHHGAERLIPGRKKVEKILKQIARPDCLAILSISDSSRQIQLDFLNHFPELKDQITPKLQVLHPPQPLLVQDLKEKNYGEQKLTFIFLGASFHRKGGAEIFRVFEKLHHNYEFELIIISRLLNENYATGESDEEVEAMRETLKKTDWLRYHHYIPNPEAMKLLRKCHVALLPTWADSYGYTVLEYQAAGCPVITTNIRAMPEMNNDDVGWLIEVPKNNLGEALYTTPEEREVMRQQIETQLEEIVVDILEKPQQISEKAERCLQRIKELHSPDNYSMELMSIYEKASSL